ncbi:MAG: nucleotidyltransferase domain-containing protein [Acidobacteria bacterium]|nr:nucleotidyltransferase domain-containing protein [Acidobacteriota bacterium]MBI3424876.1 nucleotidyltransferase domain-containing protein [Acidobacteriota bacterium]
MKPAPENNIKGSPRAQVRPQTAADPVVTLPQDVQNYLQKFRDWEESFRSPARREKYIRQICERIVERFHPEKIILFGSHADGQPTLESDLDLLVVMNFEGSPLQQAIKISRELGLVTPLDLLVRTPAQVQERLRIEDPFMREILQCGKVLYEAHHG